jgi:hypothetical protein
MVSPLGDGWEGHCVRWSAGGPCGRLALGSPWTVLATSATRAVQDLDKVRKAPRHRPHPNTGPIWLAVRGWVTSCLGVASLGLPTRQGCLTPLAPLGRHRPADLPAHPSARGARGGKGTGMPWSTTHRRGAAGAGNPIRARLSRLKVSIDKLRAQSPCCACAAIGQATAPPPLASVGIHFD